MVRASQIPKQIHCSGANRVQMIEAGSIVVQYLSDHIVRLSCERDLSHFSRVFRGRRGTRRETDRVGKVCLEHQVVGVQIDQAADGVSLEPKRPIELATEIE